MRNYFLIIALVFCSSAKSQWAVFDPTNFIANYGSWLTEINNYVELYQQTKETIKIYEKAVDQVKALEGISDWRSLVNIVRNVVDTTNAFDEFDNIPNINVNANWYRNVESVLKNTHGILNQDDYIVIYDYIKLHNSVLAEKMAIDMLQLTKRKQNMVNGMYFVSAKNESKTNRITTIESQNTKIQQLGDLSVGQSSNMINAQLLLLNQQMEELLNALNHQIMTDSSMELYKLRDVEKTLEFEKRLVEQRNNFNWAEFYRD